MMMKRYLTMTLLLLSCGVLRAQSNLPLTPKCGFELVWKNLEQRIPDFRAQYDAYVQPPNQTAQARPSGTIYNIPVVFHVVYYQDGHTTKGNLHDSVLLNQLEVLNNAFRKTHADTGNIRAIFKPLSTDAEIQFYLATTDPAGNPTSGITRTATTIEYFGDVSIAQGDISSIERIKKTAEGGKDPWDTRRYLNIWISDMSISHGGQVLPAIMGIATPPLNPAPPNWDPAEVQGLDQLTDGVVLQFQVVGNNNPYISELSALGVGSGGRTAVHEVGHYLGLRHIWGDPQPGEACTAQGDDGIDDTPAQGDKTDMQLNPPPATLNTCGAGEANDLPDLWENYMDYSKDNFQSMFTAGQVALMRTVCGNQRDSLFLSNPPPTEIAVTEAQDNLLKVYPQPASTYLNIEFEGRVNRLTIVNVLGQSVLERKGFEPGGALLDINALPVGHYYLQIISEGRAYYRKIMVSR